ncbi:MAG: DUF87 domain-containing protein [Victivallaceae bacterium]|nr:DUF87 domain-containing protein [Victivallaceae bacterium]
MRQLPDGYIAESGFIVYGELSPKGFAAKGYRLEIPNLGNAGNGLKNDLFLRLAGWLASQTLDKRIQIRYTRDADYRDILNSYRSDSDNSASDVWSRHIRNGIFEEINRKITRRVLRREYVDIYFCRKLGSFLKNGSIPESSGERAAFEREISAAFANDMSDLGAFLALPVKPLENITLFREFYRAVNKSALDLDVDYEAMYECRLADIYACEYSGITSEEPGHASFKSDGYYHNIFTLHDFPKTDIFPFYGSKLLDNNIRNLTIVVNIEAQDVEKTIEEKQKHWKRVRADLLEEESEVAASAGLDELTEHIYRLGKGEDFPLKIEYVIHTWNRDLAELQSDSTILKQAATSMFTSLDSYDLGLQSLHNFMKTLPGYLFYPRRDAVLDCMHRPLAAILPFSSSFVGKGRDGNILFEGDHGNLMTFSFFDGSTPQHTLCLGQTGSGKSVNFVSILSQSFYEFAKVVIIEEGGSYFNLTRVYGDEAQYIVIDPGANLTLNYFDTGGLPLTPAQIEFATTFLVAMCGESSDLEKIQDRAAIITPYVAAVYTDAYNEWRNKHREKLEFAARMSLTIDAIIPRMPLDQNTAQDAYFELRDILGKNDDELEGFEREVMERYHSWTVQEINDCIIDDPEILRNIAYAFMNKSDMPYHSQIVEAIRETQLANLEKSETNRIAARLAVYSIESGKGCLFDGETTIDLTKRWIHVELGKMAQSGNALKNLVGIAINNLVKNQIVNMPRSAKKLYLFEEASRFLMIPGAAEIMKQSYAQFRKFSCCAVTITQSIAQMAQSGVGQIIMTQSKMFLFLKNTDATELNLIGNYISLSDEAKQNIMDFPAPEHLPPGKKYSSFLLYAQRAAWPIVGVGRNYASPAILAAAATSGDLHSRLARLLKEISTKYPEKSFAEKLLQATELLNEDNKLFRLLERIERMAGERASPLIVEAKIAFHELFKQQ